MTTERLGSLERDVEEMKDKLNHMEARLEVQFDNLRREMVANLRWPVGISMTLWVTAILAVIFT